MKIHRKIYFLASIAYSISLVIWMREGYAIQTFFSTVMFMLTLYMAFTPEENN